MLLLPPALIDDLCDLGCLFFSNPANMESLRRFLASLGDMRPLISAGAAGAAAPPPFWLAATERASRSSIWLSILYMATSLTSFQIQVRMTRRAPIIMHEKRMIWMPRLLSSAMVNEYAGLVNQRTRKKINTI